MSEFIPALGICSFMNEKKRKKSDWPNVPRSPLWSAMARVGEEQGGAARNRMRVGDIEEDMDGNDRITMMHHSHS